MLSGTQSLPGYLLVANKLVTCRHMAIGTFGVFTWYSRQGYAFAVISAWALDERSLRLLMLIPCWDAAAGLMPMTMMGIKL